MKRIVLSMLLVFSSALPLMSVEGRYHDFAGSPPHLGSHQYKAILLIEKIKKGLMYGSNEVPIFMAMLEVELDELGRQRTMVYGRLQGLHRRIEAEAGISYHG
jgi:hypothetical protein